LHHLEKLNGGEELWILDVFRLIPGEQFHPETVPVIVFQGPVTEPLAQLTADRLFDGRIWRYISSISELACRFLPHVLTALIGARKLGMTSFATEDDLKLGMMTANMFLHLGPALDR